MIFNLQRTILVLLCSTVSACGVAQPKGIKIESRGFQIELPENFVTANARGSEFAAFSREKTLQMSFAQGCKAKAEKDESPLPKDKVMSMCFEYSFVIIKGVYEGEVIKPPTDILIAGNDCIWAEFHSTIKQRDYYFIYLLLKDSQTEVMFSGFLENKEDDVALLKEIMTSYKAH